MSKHVLMLGRAVFQTIDRSAVFDEG